MGCPYFTDLHIFSHKSLCSFKVTFFQYTRYEVNLLTLLVDDFAWFPPRLGVKNYLILMFTFSTIKIKLIKQLYNNNNLRRLPIQHGEVSVMVW